MPTTVLVLEAAKAMKALVLFLSLQTYKEAFYIDIHMQ